MSLTAVKLLVVLLERLQPSAELQALRDFALLRARLAEQPTLEHDPAFVALLSRVALFMTGTPPFAVPFCCVCTGEWALLEQLRASDGLYDGGHCAAHTAAFHARVPETRNCCEPRYHPSGDYAWRTQPAQQPVPGQD